MGTTCNIGKLNSGKAFNQVPSYGYAILDIRSFSSIDVDSYSVKIDEIANRYRVEYRLKKVSMPISLENESEVMATFARHVERITNQETRYSHSYGSSDARWFTKDGMQPIVIRPYGGDAHKDNEWLLAEDLLKYYRLVESFVLDYGRVMSWTKLQPTRPALLPLLQRDYCG